MHKSFEYWSTESNSNSTYLGKVVRLGPDEYSIDDVDGLRTIYGPGTRFEKSQWYLAFDEPATPHCTIFSMNDIKAHGQERRKYAAAYTMSTMLSYEAHVDECIEILDKKFREFSSTQKVIDFGHWMQCYAFDVIGKITVGSYFPGQFVLAKHINSSPNASGSLMMATTLRISSVR